MHSAVCGGVVRKGGEKADSFGVCINVWTVTLELVFVVLLTSPDITCGP
jgi:hypothetical protein